MRPMTAVSPMTTPVPWSMKKPLADLRAGMDIDPGRRMRVLRDDAREHCDAQPVELVREPMVDDGGEARKAKPISSMLLADGSPWYAASNVAVEQRAHDRQPCGEILHDVAALRRRFDPLWPFHSLARQIPVRPAPVAALATARIERSADEVVDAFCR